jgi:hypothetical protein
MGDQMTTLKPFERWGAAFEWCYTLTLTSDAYPTYTLRLMPLHVDHVDRLLGEWAAQDARTREKGHEPGNMSAYWLGVRKLLSSGRFGSIRTFASCGFARLELTWQVHVYEGKTSYGTCYVVNGNTDATTYMRHAAVIGQLVKLVSPHGQASGLDDMQAVLDALHKRGVKRVVELPGEAEVGAGFTSYTHGYRHATRTEAEQPETLAMRAERAEREARVAATDAMVRDGMGLTSQ